MDASTINNILRQIAMDMAYQPGRQLNGYALIGDWPQLRNDNWGMSIDDYNAGHFWSRAWAAQGGDPDTLCGEFPVLFSENRRHYMECLDDDDIKQVWDLTVIDRIDCPGCPPHLERTGEQVKRDTLLILRALIKELYTYQLSEVDRNGTITFEWISQGRAAWINSQAGWEILDTIDHMSSHIDPDPIEINEWGNYPDMRGHYTSLKFWYCEPAPIEFNYKDKVLQALGTTECPC